MPDWLLNLPVSWIALIVFVATYLIAGGVYLVVTKLALTEWARAFTAHITVFWLCIIALGTFLFVW